MIDYILWKYREFKKWLTYKLLYRAFWKKQWIIESDGAFWEILHDSENNTVTLHYVPELDYSDNDIKITVPCDRFEDLVKLMINIR